MKSFITESAKRIGIEEIGFTNIVDMSYLENTLNFRKNNNYSCEFETDNILSRTNIKNEYKWAKSIIGAVFPYAQGYKEITSDDMGLISVSSYGIDYHYIVREKLEELARIISSRFNCEYAVCVDTSPFIDRAVIKNTGLGYIGNNSMLINKNFGSFVFLGYIALSLDIESDVHMPEDLCGNCRICIEKCPNKAIMDNKLINTRRCISYLTQTKQYIPIEFRDRMTNRIYGCDVCQVNCPKNIKVANMKTNNDYSLLKIDLEEILKINNKDFKAKYGSIAGSWRGKNIWKRNAIISIGNLHLDKMYDLVCAELKNPSAMIRQYAAWTMLKLNYDKSKDIIYNSIKYEDELKDEFSLLLNGDRYDNRNL